jgi:nucleotide-binding universal stress UspA family protein
VETVLAAVDFSHITPSVVEEAVRLAKNLTGRIILLHVVNPPYVSGSPEALYTDLVPLTETMRKAGILELAKLKSEVEKSGLPVRTVNVEGFPALEIVRQAEKLSADHIVVGSHGHTSFYELLIGSTTSGILRKAKCPVVVVPAHLKPKPVTSP